MKTKLSSSKSGGSSTKGGSSSSKQHSHQSGQQQKQRLGTPLGLPKPVDQMTIEEIEALPAAKRRKSLKARGAAGPGRGWRKGLKMDQKPVYVQPGESPPSKVAHSTPSSFASRPKSSLARDALSKTSTPFRSESPYSRGSPMNVDDVLLEAVESNGQVGKAHVRSEDKKQSATAASAGQTGAGGGGHGRIYHRSTQPVLPLAKIPIGFVTVTSLDKSGSKRPVRPWQRSERQVVSLGGKAWSALSWITRQQSQGQVEKEAANNAAAALPLPDVQSPPSTPMEQDTSQQPRDGHPSSPSQQQSNSSLPLPPPRHSQPSPEIDWRGSSAAFSAAVKRKSSGPTVP